MKTPLIISIAVIALAMAGCSSISVHEDWDPVYDFSTVDSYAWLPLRATPNISDTRLKRLVAAIDAEMASKNLALTADDPSVLLELEVMSERTLDLQQYGTGGSWDGKSGDHTKLDKGSMMISVIDGEKRVLVWRAVADAKVDPSASPKEQNERYAKLAKKLLAKFPPPEK